MILNIPRSQRPILHGFMRPCYKANKFFKYGLLFLATMDNLFWSGSELFVQDVVGQVVARRRGEFSSVRDASCDEESLVPESCYSVETRDEDVNDAGAESVWQLASSIQCDCDEITPDKSPRQLSISHQQRRTQRRITASRVSATHNLCIDMKSKVYVNALVGLS